MRQTKGSLPLKKVGDADEKVLIGLLLIIPMAIVAAVVLVTNVVLITPDITVASIAIVDPDFYQDVDNVSLYFDRPGMQYQLAALVLPKKQRIKKSIGALKTRYRTIPSTKAILQPSTITATLP